MWLAESPEIPLFRGRANRAEICRRVGIARSTANDNPEVRAILAELERGLIPKHQETRISKSKSRRSTTAEDVRSSASNLPSTQREHLDTLAVEHLLKTGRIVR